MAQNFANYLKGSHWPSTDAPLSRQPVPKLKGFRVAQINIASLPKHYEELLIYMRDEPFDILTLNETRLDNSILDCEVQIPGYDIIRSYRNRNGGGVAMYIRTVIPYIIRKDLSQDTLELLSIEVKKPKSKPLLISTWYRPPSAKIELFEKFENFLKLIDNEDKDIIITGDLNCNLTEHAQNHATSKLIDIIDIFQLQQHIQTPTRTTYNSSSLIDLILTHIDDDKILEAGVVDLGIIFTYVGKLAFLKNHQKLYFLT